MDTDGTPTQQAPRGLRIGGAARVTGLTASTIRAWEQRYGAIAPLRTSSGYRLYDPETIERLQLLQVLRLRGEPLPHLATCSTEELRQRVGEAGAAPGVSAGPTRKTRVQVTLAHPTLPKTLESFPDARVPFDVVLSVPRLDTDGPDVPPATDLVIARLDALGDDPMVTLARVAPAGSNRQVVIETGFTKRAVIEGLKRRGYRTVQGPLTLGDITELALSVRRAQRVPTTLPKPTSEVPPARFTTEQLSTLRELPSNVNCECPRHLATLALQLNEFEQYSLSCHDEQPEDAALHAHLASESGRARQIVEDMLTRVCEAEGLLPEP
ncbi:MAG: MerR family transcriptional regulator [Myxococcota bacterium]